MHSWAVLGTLPNDIVTTAQLLLNSAAPGTIASLLQPNFQEPGANAVSISLIQQAMARQAGAAAIPGGALPSFLELPIPGAAGRNGAGGLADMMADPAMLMRLMGGLGGQGGDGMRQLMGLYGGAGTRMPAAGAYPAFGSMPYPMPSMGAGARGGMSDEMMSVEPRELNILNVCDGSVRLDCIKGERGQILGGPTRSYICKYVYAKTSSTSTQNLA